jgi:hypothetical protein
LSFQANNTHFALSHSPKQRIVEALNSTRRWNQDHKITMHDESVFAARYFRQQSKRDPGLAVVIQRGVQRRIRPRLLERTGSCRPESLDEFCRDVKWTDIIETVEDLLVRGERETAKMLR